MSLFQGPKRMQGGMGADREAPEWRVISTELMESFCLFGFCDHSDQACFDSIYSKVPVWFSLDAPFGFSEKFSMGIKS